MECSAARALLLQPRAARPPEHDEPPQPRDPPLRALGRRGAQHGAKPRAQADDALGRERAQLHGVDRGGRGARELGRERAREQAAHAPAQQLARALGEEDEGAHLT